MLDRMVMAACALLCGCRGNAQESPAPATSPRPDAFERVAISGETTIVFRASLIGNMTYALDCMAGLINCAPDAFATSWHRKSWSAEEVAALETWTTLRTAYSGKINDGSEPSKEPPLPIRHGRTVTDALRLAGFGARDLADYETRLALFVSAPDLARYDEVLARFRPRAVDYWEEHEKALVASAEDLVALARRPDVIAQQAAVARFLGHRKSREVVELVMNTSGETNARLLPSLVTLEVGPAQEITRTYSTVAHEMFHDWFNTAPIEKRFDLAVRFAASGEPLAQPGYILMEESVMTALDSGILTLLDPDEVARDLIDPLGFYKDEWIDGVTKRLLAPISEWVRRGKTIFDDDFVTMYLRSVSEAFPAGLPPKVYLRLLVCATESSLARSTKHLADKARGTVKCYSDTYEANNALSNHPAWSTAVLVRTENVATLGERSVLDPETLDLVREQKRSPFVLTSKHPTIGVTFVFVAANDDEMIALIDAFMARTVPLDEDVFTMPGN